MMVSCVSVALHVCVMVRCCMCDGVMRECGVACMCHGEVLQVS